MANEKRLIDANAFWNRLNNTVYDLFDPESDFGYSPGIIKSVLDQTKTVDAVEVSRLGKLGWLMMPYKGCPRGRMGARGSYGGEEIQTELEVMELDEIEDIEGDRWVPVLAEDLNKLKVRINNAVEVVRCKECMWAREKDHREPTDTPRELICQCFKHHYIPAPWGARMAVSPDDFCSYGERKDNG